MPGQPPTVRRRGRVNVALVAALAVLAPLYIGACAYIRAHRPPPPVERISATEAERERYSIPTTQPWRATRPPRTATLPTGGPAAYEGAVAPRPVVRLETAAIVINYADLDRASGSNYWEQKILGRWALATINDASSRMQKSPEEKSAVCSVLCGLADAGRTDATIGIRVPGAPWVRLYRIEKDASASDPRGRPGVKLYFIGEVDGIAPVDLPKLGGAGPAAGADVTFDSFWPIGFPADGTWRAFVGQTDPAWKALLDWISRQPAGSFSQLFRIADPKGGKHFLMASGVRTPESKLVGFSVDYTAAGEIEIVSPPEGYGNRGFGDLSLDRLSLPDTGRTRSKARIGRIAGLPTGDARLAQLVKYVISAYADKLEFPNLLHAAIPVGPSEKSLFALRFQPGDGTDVWDVIVDGPLGSPIVVKPEATPAEFAAFIVSTLPGDAATLRQWWNRRHPANKLPDDESDVAAMKRSIESMLSTQLTGKWFVENYGIFVLDESTGRDWLTTISSDRIDSRQSGLLKNWAYRDLMMLELSLNRFSEPILIRLRDVRMLRSTDLPADAKIGDSVGRPAGLTLHTASGSTAINTVFIFDLTYQSGELLFERGEGALTLPYATRTFVHEFGHVVGFSNRSAPHERFNARFLGTNAEKMTWYAASDPSDELMPEAFANHYLDGAWLKESHPDVAAWLAQLAETGVAP